MVLYALYERLMSAAVFVSTAGGYESFHINFAD